MGEKACCQAASFVRHAHLGFFISWWTENQQTGSETLSSPLPAVRLHLLKDLQPQETAVPSGDQVFKHMSLRGLLHVNHSSTQVWKTLTWSSGLHVRPQPFRIPVSPRIPCSSKQLMVTDHTGVWDTLSTQGGVYVLWILRLLKMMPKCQLSPYPTTLSIRWDGFSQPGLLREEREWWF